MTPLWLCPPPAKAIDGAHRAPITASAAIGPRGSARFLKLSRGSVPETYRSGPGERASRRGPPGKGVARARSRGRAGQLRELHEGDDQQHGAKPNQRVPPATQRELRADPDEKQNAREENRGTDVLVGRLAGGRACCKGLVRLLIQGL